MSNKLNKLITGLINLVSDVEKPTEQKFEKLPVEGEDKQVEIVSREVGSEVNIIDAEGKSTPIPNGEYELSDGFKFIIVDGKISEVVEEKPADEAPVSGEMADENAPAETAETSDVQAEIDALKAEVDSLKELVKQLIEKPESATQEDFNQFKSDFNNQESQFNKLVEALEKLPVQFSQVDNTPKALNAKDERLNALAKALSA